MSSLRQFIREVLESNLAPTILAHVRSECPEMLSPDVGQLLGSGHFGEVYVLGDDRVLKLGIAKSDDVVNALFKRLDSVTSDALVRVYDFGRLCHVKLPSTTKHIVKDGIAYFYVMERLFWLPKVDSRIAARTVNDLEELSKRPDYDAARKKYVFSMTRRYRQDGDIDGDVDPVAKAVDLFDKLRSSNVFHSDMHAQNIMQDRDGRYKFIDVESARILGHK